MTQPNQARVAVIMGSDSDWTVMKSCVDTLNQFEIQSVVKISSAHRTPDQTARFAESAMDKGIEVMIAAAGMAAHLAGVIAAHTTLPVIGVPMASGALQGVDSLLSTVQMPPGIPVATVGIGKPGAINAALLAVQIMAIKDTKLQVLMADYKKKMAEGVNQKNDKLQQELYGS